MRIGIDLGGTKTEIIALDEDGKTLLRRRSATPRGDYPATVSLIARLIEEAEQELHCRACVGIGTPGAVSPATGCIKNANSTWLIGRPLREDLQAVLQREVRLANDANCFALSEATDGAGQDADLVFGVIIGTGTGAGIVMNKRVWVGGNAIGGEWGHNPMPWFDMAPLPPRRCYCGRSGCIETYLSGPGLSETYRHLTGESVRAETIVRLAEQGAVEGEKALKLYERQLAAALASVINILDPSVIVLGGGLSNISRLYRQVPRLWREYVFSDTVTTPLRQACHGDSSGVRGAAWLAGTAHA